jgi:Spy/CpxP family protein refolding chaperone
MKFGLLAGVGGLLLGGIAFAKGGRMGGHCGWGRGGWSVEDKKKFASAKIDEVLDELKVTDDQRKQIYVSRDKLFTALEDARPDHDAKFKEITALFEKDELDLREVESLKAEHRDRIQKVEEAVTQAIVEVHSTLTPDQRKQLVAKAKKFHERFGGGE